MDACVAVVPIKPPEVGKSRLAGLPGGLRVAYARAFAHDVVTALVGADTVDAVLAVTDDFSFADELRRAGALVLPDGVTGDLNATLIQAAYEADRRFPGTSLLAVCADLPALTTADLELTLALIGPDPATAFVADTEGSGTTVYWAAGLAQFAPQYGAGSAAAHRAAGAVELAAPPGVRRDVDDLADLTRALALGAGPRTRTVAE